jgi:hypothetical protein
MTDEAKAIVLSLIDDYNRTNYRIGLIEKNILTLKTGLTKVSEMLSEGSIMNSSEVFNANLNDIENKLKVLETDKDEAIEHLTELRNRENTYMTILRSDPEFNENKFKNDVLSMINDLKDGDRV